MADAAPAANINVNVDREQTKIPIFHADPKQDNFQAEYWIDRLDRLRIANGWTNLQTVANAINSLRSDALHFVNFLKATYPNQDPTSNWALFKEEFLENFGKRTKDTSSVANLALLQKEVEPVQKFSHRVVVATDEFFDAMNAPEEPNFLAVPDNPGWREACENETVQAVVRYFVRECASTIRSYLNKTIFLNGLKAKINCQVKNTHPTTWREAVHSAVKIDRNMTGPIDHTIALEKAKASTSVNFIKRGGNPSRGTKRGGSSLASRQPSAAKPRTNTECWYCRKPGHAQKFCRKRIARGADTVPRPKSVAEITADNIDYQDGSEDEETAAPDDNDDRDDYLDDALDNDEQNINTINIAAVHLN